MQTLLCVHVTTVLYGIDQCVQEGILTGDKNTMRIRKLHADTGVTSPWERKEVINPVIYMIG